MQGLLRAAQVLAKRIFITASHAVATASLLRCKGDAVL